ncbi:hypothetical protein [Streptomyces sp. NPDC097619]|uniref:hypothetical protein n=1 Tax=Streptomyces sp. NPDC097619 TaxID=3157228 RepID=UPI00332A44B1
MITEPEYEGDGRSEAGREPLTEEPRRTGPGGRGRFTTGVLAGALAASLLWAGGLYGFTDLGRADRAPEVRYDVQGRLCRVFEPAALHTLLGRTAVEGVSEEFRGESYERLGCARGAVRNDTGPGRPRYTHRIWLQARLERHLAVDPEPEFEARARAGDALMVDPEVRRVPGLGERALFLHDGHAAWTLKVLDGGAVFTLTVEVSGGFDEKDPGNVPRPTAVDADALQSAMIEDVRGLMTRAARNERDPQRD